MKEQYFYLVIKMGRSSILGAVCYLFKFSHLHWFLLDIEQSVNTLFALNNLQTKTTTVMVVMLDNKSKLKLKNQYLTDWCRYFHFSNEIHVITIWARFPLGWRDDLSYACLVGPK